MRSRRTSETTVQVLVGFAVGEGGGIAYARLTDGSAKRVIRVEFRVGPLQRSTQHGVAYVALTAITRALVRRGIARASFILNDADFVEEVSTGRGVGDTLALPYVRLRCALNSLAEFSIASGPTDDLTQRARAEAALNTAA